MLLRCSVGPRGGPQASLRSHGGPPLDWLLPSSDLHAIRVLLGASAASLVVSVGLFCCGALWGPPELRRDIDYCHGCTSCPPAGLAAAAAAAAAGGAPHVQLQQRLQDPWALQQQLQLQQQQQQPKKCLLQLVSFNPEAHNSSSSSSSSAAAQQGFLPGEGLRRHGGPGAPGQQRWPGAALRWLLLLLQRRSSRSSRSPRTLGL
ncbi:hypothetical protein ETH_00021885 [Eimeria tenella]|uniref:Uncharacterized protein n=1 Tax=Eimeria tenella TaxID=5802 RepID=U6KNP0_EIMTE|nr:hypothetical protein ETH_00021885 [Eimeria tenella]CDJ37872.1 hypothetical protein ETH_00021885 [Eimeria tenella]|eukprot:XP_013228710.1 hypothetical protein ETH_00021885 [Eimeria tenella]